MANEAKEDKAVTQVLGSVEEAEKVAQEEAEAANVSPQAVMRSAPEGYGSGAQDSPRP